MLAWNFNTIETRSPPFYPARHRAQWEIVFLPPLLSRLTPFLAGDLIQRIGEDLVSPLPKVPPSESSPSLLSFPAGPPTTSGITLSSWPLNWG